MKTERLTRHHRAVSSHPREVTVSSTQAVRVNRSFFKRVFKQVRKLGTFWIAEQTIRNLETIRQYELSRAIEFFPRKGSVLEIGAGTGWQAKILAERGYQVTAIDLPSSNYRNDRIWPVIDYDGSRLPFEDATFDVVFSSNVLEHIPHVRAFQKEIHRVLEPDGYAVHILPSSSWRFWTNVSHLLKCWTIPGPHGEHAGNSLTEIFFFSRRRWRTLFRETGWTITAQHSNRLFYTGHSIMDSRWSMSFRRTLSRLLGGSCTIFVLGTNLHRSPELSSAQDGNRSLHR